MRGLLHFRDHQEYFFAVTDRNRCAGQLKHERQNDVVLVAEIDIVGHLLLLGTVIVLGFMRLAAAIGLSAVRRTPLVFPCLFVAMVPERSCQSKRARAISYFYQL